MKKFLVGLLALVMSSGMVYPAWSSSHQYDFSFRKGENRPTLDPRLFVNPIIRKAYAAAKRIPWVLDSIYCYCFCAESPVFRHKSLLSCYVDNHAAQ